QPEHVEMTICRDTLVLPSHHPTSLEMDRNRRRSASVEPAVTLSQASAVFLAITGPIFAGLACGGMNAVQLLAVQLLAVQLLAVQLLAVQLLAVQLLAVQLLAVQLLAVQLLAVQLLAVQLLAVQLLVWPNAGGRLSRKARTPSA